MEEALRRAELAWREANLQLVPAVKVVGGAGASRLETWIKGSCALFAIVTGPIVVFSLAVDFVWLLGGFFWGSMSLLLLYHATADGPRRCLDISTPLWFELSHEHLVVTTWGFRTQRWESDEVLAVKVFRQTDEYARSCCGVGTGFRPCAEGAPEPVEHSDQVARDFFSTASCLQFCSGWRKSCTCVFLGAELRGRASLVLLSRRVWHERGGLEELFQLAEAVQLFRARQLYVGDFAARPLQVLQAPRPSTSSLPCGPDGARLKAIAALPTHRIEPQKPAREAVDEEAPQVQSEENTCSICLEAMVGGDTVCTLPCRHVFHVDCGVNWLRLKGTCPLCKRGIHPGRRRSTEPPE
mmetsp:Transcript_44970/g.103994  ORF Transcript_44970/g.103994 Transcript_44970/m.103994 type:complete len:354 (-) Transcript_44970:260-1321(-)